MYYYVREPGKNGASNEGFAEEILLDSEIHNGRICIDGAIYHDIGFGDKIKADVKPEYALKCIKFIM